MCTVMVRIRQVTHVNRVRKALHVSTCLKSDNFADLEIQEERPALREPEVPKLVPWINGDSESSFNSDDKVFLRMPDRPSGGSNDSTAHGTLEDSVSISQILCFSQILHLEFSKETRQQG